MGFDVPLQQDLLKNTINMQPEEELQQEQTNDLLNQSMSMPGQQENINRQADATQQKDGLMTVSLKETELNMQQRESNEQNEQPLVKAQDAKFDRGIDSNPGSCKKRQNKRQKIKASKKFDTKLGVTAHSYKLSNDLDKLSQDDTKYNSSWGHTIMKKLTTGKGGKEYLEIYREQMDSLRRSDEVPEELDKVCPPAVLGCARAYKWMSGRNKLDMFSHSPEKRSEALGKLLDQATNEKLDKNPMSTLSVSKNAVKLKSFELVIQDIDILLEKDPHSVDLLPSEKLIQYRTFRAALTPLFEGIEATINMQGISMSGGALYSDEVGSKQSVKESNAKYAEIRRKADSEYRERADEYESFRENKAMIMAARDSTKDPENPVLDAVTYLTYTLSTDRKDAVKALNRKELKAEIWYDKLVKHDVDMNATHLFRGKALLKKGELTDDEKAVLPLQAMNESIHLSALLTSEEDKKNLFSNSPVIRAGAQELLIDKLLAETELSADAITQENGEKNAVSIFNQFESGITDLATVLETDDATKKLLPPVKREKFMTFAYLYGVLTEGARAVMNQHVLNDTGALRPEKTLAATRAFKKDAKAKQKDASLRYQDGLAKYNKKYMQDNNNA
ncbi:MAG: hypothetical protein RR424_06950 [Oscillospiraceae bacterium]